MSAIDRRFGSNTRQSRPRDRFWRARRTMNLALLDWLREEQPNRADVALEVDATINVVRQLARLEARRQP